MCHKTKPKVMNLGKGGRRLDWNGGREITEDGRKKVIRMYFIHYAIVKEQT